MVLWEVSGGSWESLSVPTDPRWFLGVPGRHWAFPGNPWEGAGNPWTFPERAWGSPGIPQDPPGTPQQRSLDASVGAMGALKKSENVNCYFISSAGVPLRVHGGSLRDLWCCLGGPWGGPWVSLGVARTSLNGSEWSLGVDVSATDHVVMYFGGNMMFLRSPLGL